MAVTPAALISRRTLVATALLTACAAPALAAVPPSGRIAFDALRKGHRIGQHVLSFSQADGLTTVRTEVEFAVGIGPITFYRYALHSTERWRDNQFQGLESHTEATDGHYRVTSERTREGVVVEGGKGGKGGRQNLGPAAAPLSHWNMEATRPPLFNPQDGKSLRLTPSRSRVEFNAGRLGQVAATRVTLSGEMQVVDYYDAQGLWIGLDAKAKDGSLVQYRRA